MNKEQMRKELTSLVKTKRQIESMTDDEREAMQISYNIIRHEIIKLKYLIDPKETNFDDMDNHLNL